MKADLHIHSTYSDSSRSPEEIVALAKERNVSLISICDHATIGAYDTFSRICSENNIKCVLGVELALCGTVKKYICLPIILIKIMNS